MGHVLDFAGVAGAIVLSVGAGLSLEWLGLRGLMRLMPPRPLAVSNGQQKAIGAAGRGTKAA